MKSLIALFLGLCLSVSAANGADNTVLRAGTVTLAFTPEWKWMQGDQRAEGRGPQGELLILTYRTVAPDATTDDVERHRKFVQGFANGKMPGIAVSHDKTVTRPLTETALPDGRVQYATVSQTKKMFRDYYFLQYLLGSPHGFAYLTVEGYGSAEEKSRQFDAILATQQWNE